MACLLRKPSGCPLRSAVFGAGARRRKNGFPLCADVRQSMPAPATHGPGVVADSGRFWRRWACQAAHGWFLLSSRAKSYGSFGAFLLPMNAHRFHTTVSRLPRTRRATRRATIPWRLALARPSTFCSSSVRMGQSRSPQQRASAAAVLARDLLENSGYHSKNQEIPYGVSVVTVNPGARLAAK
jgi:hypothetical protein